MTGQPFLAEGSRTTAHQRRFGGELDLKNERMWSGRDGGRCISGEVCIFKGERISREKEDEFYICCVQAALHII